MKVWTFVLFLLVASITHLVMGQSASFSWNQIVDDNTKALDIASTSATGCTTHYRIWNNYQLVDLCKQSEAVVTGEVINFVTRFYRRWGKERQKLLSERSDIPHATAHALFDELQMELIESLPDDSAIEDYPRGLDGQTFIFEIGRPDSYRVYAYWEPLNDNYVDGSIKEVHHVRNILGTLNEQLQLRQSFTQFRDKLPKGKYSLGGSLFLIVK